MLERELWQYLKSAKKPIVLYGMGNGADKIIKVLENYGISFKGVFASDGFVRDKFFHGFKISSYSELKAEFGDMIVLLCFGSERCEVIENVKRIASEQELYAPDVPIADGALFTKDYYEQNKSLFDWVYNSLADDISRKTFINTIKYKISGKIEYLFECEVEHNEPYETFLKLGKSEKFLDLGAYNGDTVADFVNRVGDYSEITAVEPDIKSFRKLALNTENLKNIKCINAAVSDENRTGLFGMRGGRNSSVSGGKTEIDFLTVDSIVAKKGVTYIKMDLEGEELRAITGARNTILTFKPKMLVSCYHKSEDLITLPRAVYNIRPDYKIYMRRFSSLPAWDTNFYFV